MDPGERKGWMEIISVEDLDTHMANIGQVQANAQIVKEMFNDYPLEKGSKLIIPGCGTGQIFDYMTPSNLGDIEMILTDINPSYLSKTQERLNKFPGTKYQTQVDDIERTQMKSGYNAALIVLVLQHVEWEKALDSMLDLSIPRFYIIEQEQDLSQHAITKRKDLPRAWKKYAEIANPQLVPRKDLIDYMKDKGYDMTKIYEKGVPDNKTMAGFVFERRKQ